MTNRLPRQMLTRTIVRTREPTVIYAATYERFQ